MKYEILYSEVCNLYGDRGNIDFLKKFLKGEFIYTSLFEEPYFVKNNVDLIYLGPMSEEIEEEVIKNLLPYKQRIKELIDKGVIFLFTGNALEILGSSIDNIKGLNIFDIKTKRHPNNRYNSLILGSYDNEKIVGYVSQSSTSAINEEPLFDIIRDKNGLKKEGIHINNFYGTNLLGPILVLNPLFTKNILSNLYSGKLPYEEELLLAYESRLEEYEKENILY